MNVSQSKINNLRTHPVIKFLLHVMSIEEYKLDTFHIIGREMFYEMVALYVTGKALNFFRHYANLVHFLPQLK